MTLGEKPQWVDKVHFVLILLVITTITISWFNVNSYFIILLLGFLFVTERIWLRIREAFTNKIFLAYMALCLVELAGMLYTDNLKTGWRNVESKATLAAIPFILFTGPFQGKANFRRIMSAYCIILFMITVFCLGIAVGKYARTDEIYFFFYHDLVSPLAQNAIVFTLFVMAALLYLLSANIQITPTRTLGSKWRIFLVIYFTAFIVLLASKLLLFVLPCFLLSYVIKRFPARKNKFVVPAVVLGLVALLVVVLTTNNPIKTRYLDILRGDIELVKREQFAPNIYFNGVQFRLLEYRFAYEILNEEKAWWFGVSPGDSQDFLDAKYTHTRMYIGTPELKDVGFLGYDSHNQFLQHLLQSGIIGLCVLVFVCFLLLKQAFVQRQREAVFFIITLYLVFLTESLLELQHGLFLFSFFPVLWLNSLKRN